MFGILGFASQLHDVVTVTRSLWWGFVVRWALQPQQTRLRALRVWTGRSGPATSRPRSWDPKGRAAFSSGVLALETLGSHERSRPSPQKKVERDSRPRASRGKQQRDTRPRPAMNPRSPKVKHLRTMVVPPLFRTFRRENPDFARTDTNTSTTATNCFQPRYLELREAGRPRRWLVVSSTHRAEVS